MTDTAIALREAHEAYQRAVERLRHALNVDICRMLHDVEVQLDQLRQMRREAERSGALSEENAARFSALEAGLDVLRVKLEAS